MVDELYDEKYYARFTEQGYEHPVLQSTLFTLAENLISICRPDAILDVGCAYNYIVHYAIREHELTDSLGLDISHHAYEHSYQQDRHKRMDVSVPIDLKTRYDLVTCVEIAEHLEESAALVLLDNLVKHAKKYIYFSSTDDPLIPEPTHINVHPREYWMQEFEKRGYVYYPYFQTLNIISWGMLFINRNLLDT